MADSLGLMPLVCLRSKSTGDPWLTDGSYFDGTGYAEIKFESQFGTTKRFEQEIRVVSYNGIIFFLENQAGACCPGEPSSLSGCAGTIPSLLAGSPGSGRWGEEGFGDLGAAWSRISVLLLKAMSRLDPNLTAVTWLVLEGLPRTWEMLQAGFTGAGSAARSISSLQCYPCAPAQGCCSQINPK